MPWQAFKPIFIGGAVTLILALLISVYATGRSDGRASTTAKVAKQAVKTLQKVAKQNEKIDRLTPYSRGKSDASDWLRRYTRKPD